MKAIRSFLVSLAIISPLAGTAPNGQKREPIAFVGHGAFFDADGKQVAPTTEFVARAQAFYRAKLFAALPKDKRSQFSALGG